MNNSATSDSVLIQGYIAGNEKCLELLISIHKKKIFNYILMQVKDLHLAEDIFQDVFIKVINTLKSGDYKDEGKFLPWVIRISHNLVIDYYRKSKHFPMVDNDNDKDIFDTIQTFENSIEYKMISDQIHTELRSLIELLPDDQKEVLKMRHYQEMSFKDIAESTEVSVNTALGRMRYAILNLRKLIEENEISLTY